MENIVEHLCLQVQPLHTLRVSWVRRLGNAQPVWPHLTLLCDQAPPLYHPRPQRLYPPILGALAALELQASPQKGAHSPLTRCRPRVTHCGSGPAFHMPPLQRRAFHPCPLSASSDWHRQWTGAAPPPRDGALTFTFSGGRPLVFT